MMVSDEYKVASGDSQIESGMAQRDAVVECHYCRGWTARGLECEFDTDLNLDGMPCAHTHTRHVALKATVCGLGRGLTGGQPTKRTVWRAEFEDDPEVLRRVSAELRGMVPAVYSDCAPSYSPAWEDRAPYAGAGSGRARLMLRHWLVQSQKTGPELRSWRNYNVNSSKTGQGRRDFGHC